MSMLAVLLAGAGGAVAQQLIALNEFMASNDTAWPDEHGEFDDWVELYNPFDYAFNLNGIYLTDDLNELDKYQIVLEEDSLLQPGEFVIVWCDNDPEQGPFHTSFALAAAGEEIGVTAPDGVMILDSHVFGAQTTDVSEGRLPDGTGDWQTLPDFTPGYSNDPAEVEAPVIPRTPLLAGNYPNPFNPSTTIEFTLPCPQRIRLTAHNLSGQPVAVLAEGVYTAGVHHVTFNAGLGRPLCSGIYIYRLSAGEYTESGKMMLLK